MYLLNAHSKYNNEIQQESGGNQISTTLIFAHTRFEPWCKHLGSNFSLFDSLNAHTWDQFGFGP